MRKRTRSQRGYALITAIVLSVLYFGLIQLMLMESARELAEARRFRARMVALTMAENGIELGAAGMLNGGAAGPRDLTLDEGSMAWTLRNINGGTFVLEGRGESSGGISQSATVRLQGRIEGPRILIDYAWHSQ
jgi:hypothetical protein